MNKNYFGLVFGFCLVASATQLPAHNLEASSTGPEYFKVGENGLTSEDIASAESILSTCKTFPYTKATVNALDSAMSIIKVYKHENPEIFKSIDSIIGYTIWEVGQYGLDICKLVTPEIQQKVCDVLNKNVNEVKSDCEKFYLESLKPFVDKTIAPAVKKTIDELVVVLGDYTKKCNERGAVLDEKLMALSTEENKETLKELGMVAEVLGKAVSKEFSKHFKRSAAK